MAEWWSIEVFSGDKLPASGWRYAYEDELTEAAITHGALYYEWHDTQHGVIFEVLFPTDDQWEAFRALPGGIACDDGTGAHFIDETLAEQVADRPAANAYRVARDGAGGATETPLPVRFLGA